MGADEPLVFEARAGANEGLAWAASRADALARGRVLDVGCGEGLFLREDRVGVDLDESRLAIARLRSPLVVRADAHALPFGDATFDTALAFRMLNAARRIDAVLAEVRRVLRPDGALLVLTREAATPSLLGRLHDEATGSGLRDGDRLDERNGAERLARFFPHVETEVFSRRLRFPDTAAAIDHYARVYLYRGRPDAATALERFERVRDALRTVSGEIEDEERLILFVARGGGPRG